MQVFWVKFEAVGTPTPLNLGVGVTARSEDDAKAIIAAAFDGPVLVELRVVDDVATLDEGHVRPNMGSVFERGIWFPRGYEEVAKRVR